MTDQPVPAVEWVAFACEVCKSEFRTTLRYVRCPDCGWLNVLPQPGTVVKDP